MTYSHIDEVSGLGVETSELDYMHDLNAIFNEIAEVVVKHTKVMRNHAVYDEASRKEFAAEAIEYIRQAFTDMSDSRIDADLIKGEDFLDDSTAKDMVVVGV